MDIRPLNWSNVDSSGIPVDCLQIMKFFNYAIENNLYPYIPRRNNITAAQILKKWVPDKDVNISIVAVADGQVVALCKGFVNKKTNACEVNVTKDPKCYIRGVGTELMKRIIAEILQRGLVVSVHTSVLNKPMIRIMEKLGYTDSELIRSLDIYRTNLKVDTFDAYHWKIDKQIGKSITN